MWSFLVKILIASQVCLGILNMILGVMCHTPGNTFIGMILLYIAVLDILYSIEAIHKQLTINESDLCYHEEDEDSE
jgi:hypothetical protein